MFNWFRRQFSKKEESQVQEAAPTQPEVSPQEGETTESGADADQEDYLNWAKAAYKNIQQRKAEQATEESESLEEAKEEILEEIEAKEEISEPIEEITPEIEPQAEISKPVEEILEQTEPIAEITPEIETKEEISEPVAEIPPEIEPKAEILEEIETKEDISEPIEEINPEIETKEEILEEIEAKEDISEPIEEITPEIEAKAEILEQTEAKADISETVEETVEKQAIPAWMQKSDRLEKLKETAIETPVLDQESAKTLTKEAEYDKELDEEFIWSAKVLAAQGRSADDVSEEEFTWLKRLRQGLGKTRRSLINQLKSIVGQGPLNEEAVTEIEALLLQADVGIEATDQIIHTLQNKLKEESLPPEQAISYLKGILREILDKPLENFANTEFVPEKDQLNIWLMTGVNGAGKTTTIGKLAHLSQKSGYSCLIAAADTFRAAAVEQVKIWGDRSNTPVIANPGKNTDPAAVVFDGISAAQSKNIDLLLVDTAGRLQNKKNLMEELAKIRRIIDKKAPNAKVESLLVLDATLGQNGLRQAQVFSEAAKLSGVVLTKLDSSAKGGVALAVAQQLNLPIRFIGAGEGIEDLRPFSSYEFVEALLSG